MTPTCISWSPTGRYSTLAYLLRENLPLLYISPSTWGNQRGLRELSSSLYQASFLTPLPGTPVYKIEELHTIFYLCFLVLLVYLSVFTFVSLIKNTKNTCYHSCAVKHVRSWPMRESEVLDCHQLNRENMKKAWDRISEEHKANMPWLPIRIVLRIFYFGLFKWCKNSLDLIAEGDFLECDEARALEIIHGLSSYFVYDGLNTVVDRIATIEKRLDALDLKGVEKLNPPREEILEIENDWETFVRVVISNQNILAFCDIGSTVSIMPSFIYDSLYLASMDKFPSFHEHSNGNISEIQGRLKDFQVMFLKRSVEIDFSIMKANRGNIVLGRDFLRAMKGFIDIGKG